PVTLNVVLMPTAVLFELTVLVAGTTSEFKPPGVLPCEVNVEVAFVAAVIVKLGRNPRSASATLPCAVTGKTYPVASNAPDCTVRSPMTVKVLNPLKSAVDKKVALPLTLTSPIALPAATA